MDRKDLIAYGALTAALLVSLGFNIAPTDTHFCPETGVSMLCERLSGTGVTCYPRADDNKGYKRCSAGWLPIVTEIDETTPEVGVGCAESESYKVCITAK